MSFWDTVAGHDFVSYTIPRLNNNLEKLCNKKQKTVIAGKDISTIDLSKALDKEIADGWYVKTAIPALEGQIIVLEK